MSTYNLETLLFPEEIAALARRGIIPGNFLESGSYGTVFEGEYFDSKCAIKRIEVNARILPNIIMEMYICKKIRHQNVVRVIDFFLTKTEHLLIFMEFLDGRDLTETLIYAPTLKENVVAKLYGQFGRGLAFMHNRGFAHRDLKPENILLNEEQTVAKLCDFGLSTQGYDIYTGEPIKVDRLKGTYPFLAPEMLLWKLYHVHPHLFNAQPSSYCPFKSDIWAMGIIVFLMLHGSAQYPFSVDFTNPEEVDWEIACTEISNVPAMLGRKFHPELSDGVKHFMVRHLKLNPNDRPDMDELLEDKWMVWWETINNSNAVKYWLKYNLTLKH